MTLLQIILKELLTLCLVVLRSVDSALQLVLRSWLINKGDLAFTVHAIRL